MNVCRWEARLILIFAILSQRVVIIDVEGFEFGQWLGLGTWFFGFPIQPNIILSRLNKICINSSAIRRHCGGYLIAGIYIDVRVVLKTVFPHGPLTRYVLRDNLI